MMRLSVQLEMGMFSATVCGLIGVAFGMNLDSFLEQVRINPQVQHCYSFLVDSLCILVYYWNDDWMYRVTMAKITDISGEEP